MRVLVHDFGGHAFAVQLSRELSRRGHDVVHSTCAGYVSGKGTLAPAPGETIRFVTIGDGMVLAKDRFARRLLQELRLGVALIRQVRRERPDVVMLSNVQIPMLTMFALVAWITRTPWVLWHQDVYAVAMRSFVGAKLSRSFAVAAWLFEVAERFCARRANAVVVIADSFLPVHRRWGTEDKTTVIPNWAPLAEIDVRPRHNSWSAEQGLDEVTTLLYSGTLGLKHEPALLVQLARQVIDAGAAIQLVIVNEGPAVEVVRAEADRLSVPLTILPFQPFDRLPEVLASGDLLLVLLDQAAGTFSVPSKTLTYLCAGRPILGLMPAENLASELVTSTGGGVFAPTAEALPDAARWAVDLLADPDRAAKVGTASRELAEREFDLSRCTDRFEDVLSGARR